MSALKKVMNNEIKKYHGNIYYFDKNKREIFPVNISTLYDYSHYELELHHVVPFTDWEKNTKNVQSKVNNSLILLPKEMHQHLENPIYKLSKEKFELFYGINPDAILYDVNSKVERTCNLFNQNSFKTEVSANSPDYLSKNKNYYNMIRCGRITYECLLDDSELSCFDEIYSEVKHA